MNRVIWWIRRDIRLQNNTALNAALEYSEQVIPLFILDERLFASNTIGKKRKQFLIHALQDLDRNLRKYNSYLIIRKGKPEYILSKIIEELEISMVFSEPDFTPYALQRDQRISELIPIQWEGSPYYHPPGSIIKQDRTPYIVFTPFSKAWKGMPFSYSQSKNNPVRPLNTPKNIDSEMLELNTHYTNENLFPANEAIAQQRLSKFTEQDYQSENPVRSSIFAYKQERDRVDLDGTSKLSPYLRFGLLSIRQVVHSAQKAIQLANQPQNREAAQIWLNELIWREFYGHILYHFPKVHKENFRLSNIEWKNDHEEFNAWKLGETGYPLIDAAMHQLQQTGWMHNRARMIVASFLTKDLLIDWRWGEHWFMQHLIDGDPASNNGGWQWTAGTGTDATPYFRIFNPITQSKKYDPLGRYIRHWIPTLSKIPDAFIHEPWKMPDDIQRETNCVLGSDYPFPIIDHQFARQRALNMYKSL